MLKTHVLLFISAVITLCNSASLVEIVNRKCDVSDNACHLILFNTAVQELTQNGLTEFGGPTVDPYVVKNVQFSYFGMLTVTIVDGSLKGLKSCKIEDVEVVTETKRAKIKLVCDKVIIDGQYKLRPTPALTTLADGINISGDGKGVLTVDNLILNLDLSIAAEKLDDGELHFKLIPEDSTHSYEVGTASSSLDNVLVGSQDISTVLVNIFNENPKPVLKTIAPPILDEALKVVYELVGKILSAVTAKDFIKGDVSAFIKN